MTASLPHAETKHDIHWQSATWADYERYRDEPQASDRWRLFFNDGCLMVQDMGWEGIGHAQVKDLFIMLLTVWFMAHPDTIGQSMSGCLMEKSGQQAAAPDLLLYVGAGAPEWQPGEPRRIDLGKWRLPDLVGEVSDTTLGSDLAEMKDLYEALGVPEYWVVDVIGRRVLVFCLQADGKYQECTVSNVLPGLSIALLEAAIEHYSQSSNLSTATWFMQRINPQNA
jgi:Uma2 family endonuclease